VPGFLDAIELSKKHFLAAIRRRHLEDKTNTMFSDTSVSHEVLRELQDQVFNLRRDASPVPGWFYRLLKTDYEEDMRYAAKAREGRGLMAQVDRQLGP
jgi:hypothetical protein